MNKRFIRTAATDSLLLFLISLPSAFFRTGHPILFILLTLVAAAAFTFFVEAVFKDGEQSLQRIFLPFLILSAVANVFCGILTTFPFALAAAVTAFSKKLLLFERRAAKSDVALKFHPYFTTITAYAAALVLIYAITGVNV